MRGVQKDWIGHPLAWNWYQTCITLKNSKRLMINVDNQDAAEPKTIEDRQVAVGDRSRFLTALNEATNRSKRARAIRGVGR